jgi:hypothetical protein
MNVLYPKVAWQRIPLLAGVMLAGALIAGLYGAMHDQVTYSIGPEYFTKMKFFQFRWADLGFPPRVFVSEIGFLASWWVGLIAGWFVARMTVTEESINLALRRAAAAYAIIFGCTVAAAVTAYGLSRLRLAHASDPFWQEVGRQLQLTDPAAFFSVAYIHNGSYLGGALGTLVALFWLWRTGKQCKPR